MRWIARFVLSAVALMLWAQTLPGIHVDSLGTAMIAVFMLSLVNLAVRPILVLLTLPLTVLTLGLFLIVVNVFSIGLAAFLTPGFEVSGFWWIFIFGIVMGLTNTAIEKVLEAKD